VIETIPAMARTTHADGARNFANQRWLSYTGASPDEMAGTGWKEAFHPADIDRHMEKCRESLATGKPFENEARVRCAVDGRYRWFLHRAVALRDERGDIVKWYGTASDIEDLKQAENKLRLDEEELRRITDAAVDGSCFSPQPAHSDSAVLSERIAAQEKELIEVALAESKGRVSGPSGAAAKLGIPQSTLDFKIKSLKINKELFKSTQPKLPV
jgi:PAS domain S-box-containing protein